MMRPKTTNVSATASKRVSVSGKAAPMKTGVPPENQVSKKPAVRAKPCLPDRPPSLLTRPRRTERPILDRPPPGEDRASPAFAKSRTQIRSTVATPSSTPKNTNSVRLPSNFLKAKSRPVVPVSDPKNTLPPIKRPQAKSRVNSTWSDGKAMRKPMSVKPAVDVQKRIPNFPLKKEVPAPKAKLTAKREGRSHGPDHGPNPKPEILETKTQMPETRISSPSSKSPVNQRQDSKSISRQTDNNYISTPVAGAALHNLPSYVQATPVHPTEAPKNPRPSDSKTGPSTLSTPVASRAKSTKGFSRPYRFTPTPNGRALPPILTSPLTSFKSNLSNRSSLYMVTPARVLLSSFSRFSATCRQSPAYPSPAPAAPRRRRLRDASAALLHAIRVADPTAVKDCLTTYDEDPNALLPPLPEFRRGFLTRVPTPIRDLNSETTPSTQLPEVVTYEPDALFSPQVPLPITQMPLSSTVRSPTKMACASRIIHPLILGGRVSSPAVVACLLEHGAAPNALDWLERNTLHVILSPEESLIAEYTCMEPDLVPATSRASPLTVGFGAYFKESSQARSKRYAENAFLLIEAGLQVHAKDSFQQSAVDYACQWLKKEKQLGFDSEGRSNSMLYEVVNTVLLHVNKSKAKVVENAVNILSEKNQSIIEKLRGSVSVAAENVKQKQREDDAKDRELEEVIKGLLTNGNGTHPAFRRMWNYVETAVM